MLNTALDWPFGLLLLGVGLGTALLAGNALGIRSPTGRNAAIDGLRGYLAFGVFLHHAAVWHGYVRTAQWALPPPSVYRDLGPNCVSLFFMITAYLFIGKLLDERRRPIDWTALFVSRVLRLTPLYLIAMAALLCMVGFMSDWVRREPWPVVLSEVSGWLTFSLYGAPDINEVRHTAVLIAIVTWSLAYEWLFYLALPTIALMLRRNVPLAVVLACTALFGILVLTVPRVIFPSAFLVGAAAAVIARRPRLASALKTSTASVLVLAAAAVIVFGPGSRVINLAMLATVFLLSLAATRCSGCSPTAPRLCWATSVTVSICYMAWFCRPRSTF